MKLYRFFLTLSLALCLSVSASAKLQRHMIGDLETVEGILRHNYAPKTWKEQYFGWDLDTEVQKAKTRLHANDQLTLKDFQHILAQFLKTTNDYHVGILYRSKESASLPFRVLRAQDHYYFSFIDRSRLPLSAFPYKIGDELVLFDGRPTHEVVQELRLNEVGFASEETDLGIATTLLTCRVGALGNEVPRGEVLLGIKSKKNDTLEYEELEWNYNSGNLRERAVRQAVKVAADYTGKTFYQTHRMLRKRMEIPTLDRLKNQLGAWQRFSNDYIGSRKSYIPYLSANENAIWRSDNDCPYHAYIYRDENERPIGYIRLCTFDFGEAEFNEFKEIIALMQQKTDALVIDQINNPGGIYLHMYAILSLLTDKPLNPPKHRVAVTKEDIEEAKEMIAEVDMIETDEFARFIYGDSFDGYRVTLTFAKGIKNYLTQLTDEWNAGHTLTYPLNLLGVETIEPDQSVHYTKPILVVVNGLSISCGDFFPAILQDNNRAVIFGTKTAGAGGYVTKHSYPNRSGIENIHYTSSIALRSNDSTLENLGVTPDIIYQITDNDVQHGFKGYRDAINNAVNQLLSN